MLYLDLDEIDEFFKLSPLWSRERFNWASFYRQDYLGGKATESGDQAQDLKQTVYKEIERQTGKSFSGRVCMLAHVRYFGYCFNPATFYYCFNGTQLQYLVTEVSNTPWGEKHCYVSSFEQSEHVYSSSANKVFHVSPFLGMEQTYRWHITNPGDNLRIFISNFEQERRIFSAGLNMQRRPATTKNLNRALLRFPATTIKTVSSIYWQALRLWLKGAPIFNHPNNRTGHSVSEESTDEHARY